MFQPVLCLNIGQSSGALCFSGSTVIQIGRITGAAGGAILLQLHKVDVLGDDPLGAARQQNAILNGILDVKQQPGVGAVIAVVHKNRALLEYLSVALPHKINDGFQQRMSGAKQFGWDHALHIAALFFKAHPFVSLQHWLPKADLHIPAAHRRGHKGDLVASGLARAYLATHRAEGFQKECLDKVGLQLVRLHPLHLFPDGGDLLYVHGVIGQSALIQKLPELFLVQRVVYDLLQPGTDGRVVAVADRLDQQLPQGFVVKGHLAQNIKHLAAQCTPFFFQLLEQPLEHHALTGLRRNQIPQVAHLGLPDAVNAAEPLLQTVWIPWQVVVYHQVRSL